MRRTAPQLMKQAHGASPVSHRASRICMRYLLKLIVGLFVGKGVQQRDPAFKRLLHCRRAGCGKRNRAQLFIGIKMMMLIIEGEGERRQKKRDKKEKNRRLHSRSLMFAVAGCQRGVGLGSLPRA